MIRTEKINLTLPKELKLKARQLLQRRGQSFSSFLKKGLEKELIKGRRK